MNGSKRTQVFDSGTMQVTFRIAQAAGVRTYMYARRNPCLICGWDYEMSCGTIRNIVFQFAQET